jgi:BCD family chlorophyll transporter-like MFS transporter
MNRINRAMMNAWTSLGPRFLPFADAATPDLPLSRLLRLSLFQVSVGMALVLLIGTLNRVMIVELGVPASLVAVVLSLPLLFAPFRALIGFRSDTHHSALGWKRVPFIWKGTMVQFGGLAIMPFALLVLAGQGNAQHAPAWIGQLGAAVSFLLVGAGLHTTQTVGLALATDLAPVEAQPKVVGLMYVMLLLGMIASAFIFGALLADFSPLRLVQVVQGSAVVTMILNPVALWKQETRRPARLYKQEQQPTTFRDAWNTFAGASNAIRRLIAVGLGTMAFSMEDVLLEPYGGQVLALTVGATTKLTATLAIGGLFGFGLAARVLSRGFDPFRMASYGAMVGIPAFLLVILAAPYGQPMMFALGTLLIGFGGGLFGHGTLTATMNLAPESQTGLALGAWGAVQASAAGVAVALGGILRDIVGGFAVRGAFGTALANTATGYMFVYALEIVLMIATIVAMIPLLRRQVAQVPETVDEAYSETAWWAAS